MLPNKTPDKVLQAFASLRSNPSFVHILEYLRESLKESDSRARSSRDLLDVGRYQGCSLTLELLIEKAQTAHLTLNQKEQYTKSSFVG